jgi:hypothetical protein
MTGGIRFLSAAFALGLATAASAQSPPTFAELDKRAVDVLRDIHNRGAELYNRGDPAGCYRMYEGALVTIRPSLTHRPAVTKTLDDGLADVAKSPDGVKVQAFRLHELIEKIRADLKGEPKKAEPKKAEPETKAPQTVSAKPPAAKTGQVKGLVTLDGQPLAAAEVAVVTLDLPRPRVFTAKVTNGAYAFADELPTGKYVLIVTGKGVPEKFGTTLTSGLRVEVAGGPSELNLDLKSK